ncbi:MAG: ion transporter [Halobacteriota archaeon]|jgi:voltage-gated potassium channel
MKPAEKLPDLLEFFNIVARIRRLNEVFRLSSRIRYLYEVLCFILILFDGFFLFVTVIFPLKSGTLEAVATFDAVVVLFLWVEYLFRVNEQDDKWRYVAYQWSDILAIIPFDYIALVSFGIALPLTIAFKLLRLARIVALLRFSRRIEREVLAFAEKTRLIYGLAIYLLVIIVGALLFFYIESPVNPTVSTPNDALWYMIVTMTTVGYGDIVPRTGFGRIIGVIAMITAILFASLVTATTTSALMEKFRAEREEITEASKETIGNVLAQLSELRDRLDELPKVAERTDEIKADLDELKAMRAEVQSLKESVEGKK